MTEKVRKWPELATWFTRRNLGSPRFRGLQASSGTSLRLHRGLRRPGGLRARRRVLRPGRLGPPTPSRRARALPGCSTAKVRQSWRTSRLKDRAQPKSKTPVLASLFLQPKTGANPTDFHIGRARAAATTLRGAWWGCPRQLAVFIPFVKRGDERGFGE